MIENNKHLTLAIVSAVESDKAIMEIYQSTDCDVSYKVHESPLTKADLASHHKIVSFLEPTGIPLLQQRRVDEQLVFGRKINAKKK